MQTSNAMSPLSLSVDGDVAIFTLDSPGRTMNVVDESVFDGLESHLAAVAENPAVRAVVLVSGKPGSFGAGADLSWLPELVARPGADEFLTRVHALMYRIADGSMPFVTAIDGPALGGAFEIALSSSSILATPRSKVGLPEITLGLMPGGAGTQLIRRRLTTEDALRVLLEGRQLDADVAAELGLIDEVVPPDELIPRALELARAPRPDLAAPRDTREDAIEALARAESSATTMAARGIVEVVRTGVHDGPAAGCAAERRVFLQLIDSREARARIHLFEAEGAIRRRARGMSAAVGHLGVVGGGQMGAGVAATALSRGMSPVVRDVDSDRLDSAAGYARRVLSRRVPDVEVEARMTEWSGTVDWDGFAGADAVIEAVFELLDVKQETLAGIGDRVGRDTLIATNTSAIPIGTLATAVPAPQRFLGMHFFSPVERMPLVELIPHAGTSSDAVDRATSLGVHLGKVPVIVADRPGFFTSRVYARWLIEGVRLLLDGVPADQVEVEAKQAGFPVGPLQACDEATLDLVVKASILQVAQPVMSDRLDISAVKDALESLIGAGVEGRRRGQGFYAYEDGRRGGLNPIVAQILPPASRAPEGAAGERLVYAFVSECLLCWDDGTLQHPDDGDIASVLGIGFPRVLGGPFHWADAEGLKRVRERARELGAAFPVGDAIGELIASGSSFGAQSRRTVTEAVAS